MKNVLILLMIISLTLCPVAVLAVEDGVTEEIATQEEVNNQESAEAISQEDPIEESAEASSQEEALEEPAENIPQEEDLEEITEEEIPPEKNTKLITELYAFNAALYFCDTPTNRVVLRGIAPTQEKESSKAMAKEAENLEIRISPDGLYMSDGTKISLEDLNTYADSEAWLIIARTADGNLIIPYFQLR